MTYFSYISVQPDYFTRSSFVDSTGKRNERVSFTKGISQGLDLKLIIRLEMGLSLLA